MPRKLKHFKRTPTPAVSGKHGTSHDWLLPKEARDDALSVSIEFALNQGFRDLTSFPTPNLPSTNMK
jgi:hypothetical protein